MFITFVEEGMRHNMLGNEVPSRGCPAVLV